MTRPPASLASLTRIAPRNPTPMMATVWPARMSLRQKMLKAQPNGSSGKSSCARASGSFTTCDASARSNCAYALPLNMPTRSPACRSGTPSPVASTTPQPSCPSAPGSVGNCIHSGPSQGVRFEAHTPQPSSRTRTCPAPGSGTGTSWIFNLPAPVRTAAFIISMPFNLPRFGWPGAPLRARYPA